MKFPVPENLTALAAALGKPLYVVGGSVRDFLAGFPSPHPDWDICSPAREEEVLAAAEQCGFSVKSVYRRTGTVKMKDGRDSDYEFTRFRSDRYVRGEHTPRDIEFTEDIETDARRRDFCANAVYYEINAQTFCDPLGGIADIENKILRTVAPAEKVFGEDGLRLLRLARLAAQTGFAPDEECLAGAYANRALIRDIVPQRIFTELDLLLHADEKHGCAEAPYHGLHVLKTSGVLDEILPELASGDGMKQRADFHDCDVLEHTFRCVRYAPPEIRFAALLHDVGKPFCHLRDGNFYAHAEEGARIAEEIMARLSAPKKLTEDTVKLVRLQMRDFNLAMRENKVRAEIVKYRPFLENLLALKQADYSACKGDLSPAPAVLKWNAVLETMIREGVPFTVRELAVNGKDLQALGVAPEDTGTVLQRLLGECIPDGSRNAREFLLARAEKIYLRRKPQ